MVTLVFVQAHPDDECILTGATLARAAELGMRTVLVYGTRGDAGQTSLDLGGVTLGEWRMTETVRAAAVLGVDRIEWLPYADSGMADTETNTNPDAFSKADPHMVAAEIAALVADEEVAAVVGYDANGTYGHPDHVAVHHVGRALATRLRTWALDATYSREQLAALPDADGALDPGFASAEADLTHFVQGEDLLQTKVAAVAHHHSQTPDEFKTGSLPVSYFRARFGTEWYIATPPSAGASLGRLEVLFRPKVEWPGPLPDPDADR